MNKAKQTAMFMLLLGGVGAGAYSLYQFSANGTSVPSTGQVYQAIVDMNARQLAMSELDSLTGVVTFVWDDNRTEMGPLYDSLGVWTTQGRFANSFTSNGLKGGFAFETQSVMSASSTMTVLSISEIRALVARGNFDVGTVAWDETAGLYGHDYGLIASGAYSSPDTFYNNILNGVKAQRDTLGLGAPKWISHSFSSASWVTSNAARRAGIPYGYAPNISATVPSSTPAPREVFLYDNGRWGAWDTGGSEASAARMAAGPGRVLDRYAIGWSVAETSTFAAWKANLDRAAQVKGLVVFIGHRPDIIGENVAASLGMPTTGPEWRAAAFDSFCSWIKVRYIDTGRVVAMTPGDAADHFFKRPIGPLARFEAGDFVDIDGDGHLDGWTGDNAGMAASDTALLFPTAYVGHGGGATYALNWAGVGSRNSIIGGGGAPADSTWEVTNAMLAVVPPAGGGWTIHVELWAICDTTVASAVKIAPSASGPWAVPSDPPARYVGISFFGPNEANDNRWGTAGAGGSGTIFPNATSSQYGIGTSFNAYAAAGPLDYYRLSPNNNIHRAPHEWAHIVAEWKVPDFSDYVFINIYKHKIFPVNEVLISDYSVTFYRSDGLIPITN